MNELTATYQQNTTGLPEAFRTLETGSEKSPGKTNGCFFQGLDYYPYGMEMPGRTFTAQTYRYAYQGSEQAPEYNSAGGNVYTTFFRTLDSRLGRWFTPDVVSQPWQSPYCSMDNNPVALVDPWGAESEGGSSEPGFESGRGTNENPIQIEEITVTGSRSAGTTSSAPSRTNIYVNTFNPENQAANQIRNQQAQEDFENSAPEQNEQVNYQTNMWMSTQCLGAPNAKKLWKQKSGIHFTSPDATGDGAGVKAQDEESVHTADAEWVYAISYYGANPNKTFQWVGKIFNWFTFPETHERDNYVEKDIEEATTANDVKENVEEQNRQVHGKPLLWIPENLKDSTKLEGGDFYRKGDTLELDTSIKKRWFYKKYTSKKKK